MTKELTVWWDTREVGTLCINQHGDMEFTYAAAWLSSPAPVSISRSLPLQTDTFGRRACAPFFEGLLPEETQRVAIAKTLGISKQNIFSMLVALGGDVAGALSLWPVGERPPSQPEEYVPTRLSNEALIETIESLPMRPMLAGDDGLRVSLAGAQEKLPVILVDDRIALPAPGQPTTHILKPPISRFEGTTENEALAMRVAEQIKLNVAPVEIRNSGDHRFLLVERYDRTVENGVVRRLHQEDFCQALGYNSAQKYAADGGPVFRDCFDLIRDSATQPARDLIGLMDGALYNLIIGNADAHGKNFSLLYEGNRTSFAPLYDLMITAAYPQISTNMAMKIARRRNLEELTARDWGRFSEETGMTQPYIKRRLAELCDRVSNTLQEATDSLASGHRDDKYLITYAEIISARIETAQNLV